MKIRSLIAGSVLAMSLAATGAAHAVVLPPVTVACSSTDFTGATIQACQGFFGGNDLSGSTVDVQTQALANLGFTWDGTTILQSFANLAGGNPTFTPDLFGISYIGVHYGNGGGSPNGTAFYRIDAGAGISSLTLNPPFQATSNLLVYGTGTGGGVPEPATWAMMILGMGGVGAALRSRRRQGLATA
jgi:PEP-CTERM motif